MTDREEQDAFGAIAVPASRLWGAQTERSRRFFAIGDERMPPELVDALVMVKRAAAEVNGENGLLAPEKARAIISAADEILEGRWPEEFPLSVWQTGSGTQTNMNVNEVLANRASELLGGQRGTRRLVHPNDDVNRAQSSNDVFPTAMHVAAARAVESRLLPALDELGTSLGDKSRAFADVIKVGRTHLQDATPVTFGQELGGYRAQLMACRRSIVAAGLELRPLAIGGTAVGTGINAPAGFGPAVARALERMTGIEFSACANKFALLAAHDALVQLHGTLRTLAGALSKMANDLRLLASGPRAGLGEITLPANEPGSSIMPGKVNPTQCEALWMVCAQVAGNDVAVGIGGAGGVLELNVAKPLIIRNVLASVTLLSDSMNSFCAHCVAGIEVNRARMQELVSRSLMLSTALAPHIGYDRAAAIAKSAHDTGRSLREAALASGAVTAAQFDLWVQPESMLGDPETMNGKSA